MLSIGKLVSTGGFVTALVAGFFTWWSIGGSIGSFTLLDAYKMVIKYASSGGASSAFNSSALRLLLNPSYGNFALLSVVFVIVLIFWPASVIEGVMGILGRGPKLLSGIYGIVAVGSAYFFSYELASDVGHPLGLGSGLDLEIAAIIMLFSAYFLQSIGQKEKVKIATPSAQANTIEADSK
jgi:hypothetical protein